MPDIHALLIGINNYPVTPLQGCINDVLALKDYLHFVYDNDPAVQLNITTLTDNDSLQPTRQHIINAFDIFSKAKENDICLFYYSGHGSFSTAPADLVNSDDANVQSFVCIDSRTQGGRDLMDKEMGFLIWKALQGKEHVQFVAITDCCHAGTITKDIPGNTGITERMITGSTAHFPGSVKEYLGYDAIGFKQGKHIHLAASQGIQTAKELVIEGKTRGAFTYALLKTLYASQAHINYEELLNRTAIFVRNMVQDQQPLYHLNGGLPASEKEKIFLSSSSGTGEIFYFVYHDPQFNWCLQAGPLQGIKEGNEVMIEGIGETYISGTVSADLSLIFPVKGLEKGHGAYKATVHSGLAQQGKVDLWKHVLEFNNPANSLTDADYSIQLFRSVQTDAGFEKVSHRGVITDLHYKASGEQPAIRLLIKNTSSSILYITHAWLGFDYSITPTFFADIILSAGKEVWMELIERGVKKDIIPMQIDPPYLEAGYTAITEWLKLFISKEKISTLSLQQEGMNITTRPLNLQKMRRPEKIAWQTETIGLRTIRSLSSPP